VQYIQSPYPGNLVDLRIVQGLVVSWLLAAEAKPRGHYGQAYDSVDVETDLRTSAALHSQSMARFT